MPRNIEIKVRLADIDAVRAAVVGLRARHAGIEDQTDRYFELDGGRRVKLRTLGSGAAQLIHYDRPETDAVRASDYTVTPVRDAEAHACLVPKGPPRVIVRKQREIFLLDNVRIHLDRVHGLGTFLELEAVIDVTHDEATCRHQVDRIMAALGLQASECLRASYSDLLAKV